MDKINMHKDHEASCFCCLYLEDDPSEGGKYYSAYSLECTHPEIKMHFYDPDTDEMHELTRGRTCPHFDVAENRPVSPPPHKDAGNIKFENGGMFICDNEGKWLKIARLTNG